MTDVYETYNEHNCTIKICHDSDSGVNPRTDYDHPFTIYYPKSSRYTLGDKAVTEDEMNELVEEARENGDHVFPVFAYIHSGVAFSTAPFSDGWDSGQVGWAIASKEDLEGFTITPLEVLKGELQEYTDYCNGNIFGWIVERGGEEVEAVWGYIGDPETSGCLDDARTAAKAIDESTKGVGSGDPVEHVTLRTKSGCEVSWSATENCDKASIHEVIADLLDTLGYKEE